VPGAELPGVLHALDFLERVNRGAAPELGQRVLVVGGGNAAVDSARSALRLGADVSIVYRRQRTEMPAIVEEVHAAEEEGVKLVFLAAPHRVLSDKGGRVTGLQVEQTELGEFDSSGRRTPLPTGEHHRLPCDTLILAIGEKVDARFLREFGLATSREGTLSIDRFTSRTSRNRIYAGGDVVTGASNVSNAMAWAKQAAERIDEELMGRSRLTALLPRFDYENRVPVDPEGGPRNPERVRPAAERAIGFGEVSMGLTGRAAKCEAIRCLRCDVKVVNGTAPAGRNGGTVPASPRGGA
jgi:NADH-quinone oxidoreductase subunit F